MKSLTKSDVYDVALDLIEENGSTTTLDVKTELRARNFSARQADVSEHMIEIAAEEKWGFSFNGVHRVYKIATAQPATNASLSNQLKSAGTMQVNIQNMIPASKTVATSNTGTPSYTKRDGSVIATIQTPSKGDYKVFSVSNSAVLYFSGREGYSRTDVRFAFAKITGTPFIDTRIKAQY
jgi:hypothetical protein